MRLLMVVQGAAMDLLKRMGSRIQLSVLALAVALPGAAFSHPHVFIDASFELVFDDSGDLAAVRID